MIGTRYAWPSPMPCKIHVSMFRGECDESVANCKDFKAVSPTGLLLCKRKRVRGEFTCRQTSSKFSCSHKIGGHSLDEKFRADASLMRISRQIERDEMCYRNDEGVVPFRRK